MLRVGIVGATGYTALELLKLLARHPEAELTRVTSRESAGQPLASVHSGLRNKFNVNFTKFSNEDFAANVDFAFCCLPHAASAKVIANLADTGIKIVDFSADYRLDDVATFEYWYDVTHPDPDRVGHVPYGIPELFGDDIANATLVANPGCFPTSVIIPVTPLLKSGLVLADSIIVDSKTGVSGAGRKPNLKFHFPECNESVTAYAVGKHRHAPEMEQILGRSSGRKPNVIFTPHLVPMDRGIFSTIYLNRAQGATVDQLLDSLADTYRREPFVRVTDELPKTKDVAGTNFCDITVRQSGEKMIVLCAIDNLIKGASGAAIQNFNLMSGFDQTLALI